MADGTKIEWTDATVNAVNGCSVVSPGCTNCYAMRLAGTRLRSHPSRAGLTQASKAGPVWNGMINVNYDAMHQPLSWRRPRRLFWNAHGDLFHDAVPIGTIAQVFGVAIAAHHLHGHISQLLTKRAERQRDILNRPAFWDEVNANASMHVMERVDPLNRRSGDARATLDGYGPVCPPPGIWLGTSVEDQQRADERIPHLLATPAAVRFLSCEPLLGALDLTALDLNGDSEMDALNIRPWADEVEQWRDTSDSWEADFEDWYGRRPEEVSGAMHPTLDWIIVGGESGPGARPMHPNWARSLRDQCADAGVAFFHKQNGEFAPGEIAGDYLDPEKAAKGWSYFDGRWDECWSEVEGHCDDEPDVYRIGKKRAGRLLDGVEHNGFPPTVAA